jgi:NDP-sugar pyrophosphorylase family protein
MLPILGKPFLEYQLDFLRNGGVKNIVLCTGHMGEQIEDYFGDGDRFGVSIRYSREERLLGTAGALKKAGDLLDDVFFTLYGDSYVFLDFTAVMSFFKSKNKLALMSVYKNNDKYERSNTVIAGELVTKYSKREKSDDIIYIEYGANIFRKEALDMIPEGHYSLEELFPRLIAKGELLAYEANQRFYQIGSSDGLKEFQKYARDALNPRHVSGKAGKNIEGS